MSTVLTPIERVRVDVASQGKYNTLHRASVDDVVGDLRARRATAVLISVSHYDATGTARMAAMLREFPRVPTFALLSDVQRSTPYSVHTLGRLGVRTLIDVRHPSGWSALRDRLVKTGAGDMQQLTLETLHEDLVDAPADCWHFFEVLFTHRPYIATVRQVGRAMNVLPATLMSRFYRARLPSPKRYVDVGRLIRAARLLENPGFSVSSVAKQLDYSSPQAFCRHIRGVCGMTAVEFRQHLTGEAMLGRFRDTLVVPYLDVLRRFRPVEAAPGWIPKHRVQRYTSQCYTAQGRTSHVQTPGDCSCRDVVAGTAVAQASPDG